MLKLLCVSTVLLSATALVANELEFLTGPEGHADISIFAASETGDVIVGQAGPDRAKGRPFYWSRLSGPELVPLPEGASDEDIATLLGRSQAVTPDGNIIAGRTWDAESKVVGFIYNRTTSELDVLGSLGGTSLEVKSRIIAISFDGSTAVGQAGLATGGRGAFRYTKAGGMTQINGTYAHQEPNTVVDDWAYGVSGDGQRICGFYEVLAWNGSQVTGLVNNYGWVYDAKSGVWRELTALSPEAGHTARGISGDGRKVVGWGYSADLESDVATIWDFNTLNPTALGILDGFEWSHATSINQTGSVVAGYLGRMVPDGNGGERAEFRAMVWTSTLGMLDLNNFLAVRYGTDLGEWVLRAANVNPAGTALFGTAVNTQTQEQKPYLLRLPEALSDSGLFFFDPPAGAVDFPLMDITEDGRTIVGQAGSGFGIGEAAVWNADTGITDYLPRFEGADPEAAVAKLARAQAVSADGRYIVGRTWDANGFTAAFRYDQETSQMIDLGDLGGVSFGSLRGRATGISDDGSVVVGQAANGAGAHAFRWTEDGGIQFINVDAILPAPVPPYSHWAYGVSADGTRLAGWIELYELNESTQNYDLIREYPYIHDVDSGARALELPIAGGDGLAYAISADGSTVVGAAEYLVDGGTQTTAVLWDAETGAITKLGVPRDWGWSIADSVSHNGSVVAGYLGRMVDDGNGGERAEFHGFLWTLKSGLVDMNYDVKNRFDLEYDGYTFIDANVGDNGRYIFGSAWSEETQSEKGYLLILPETESADYAFLPGSFDLSGGWRWSAWFGNYHTGSYPWVYSQSHGWLYAVASDGDSMWFYDQQLGGIFYTTAEFYPFMYLFDEDGARAIRYLEGTTGIRWFFDYSEGGGWFSVGE